MSCLTHAQLKLLDIYPKFTDGEPVLPGDEFADNGRLYKLSRVEIAGGSCILWDSAPRAVSCRLGSSRFGRPEEAVLRDPDIPERDSWGGLWRDAMEPGGVEFDVFAKRARALRNREIERDSNESRD